MRLVVDLMGAQTRGSRVRGIGRYTRELALALAQRRDPRIDLRFVLSDNFPDAAAELRAALAPLLPPNAITSYTVPAASGYARPQSDPARRAAEAIVRRHLAGLAPEVLLASSIYEVAAEDFAYHDFLRQPARLSSAILYDLIPLRMPNDYLRQSDYRRVYHEQTKTLGSADLLFAISECSRQDAIRLLGIPADRIVNIAGAADSRFHPEERSADDIAATSMRLGVRPPFIFCAAGDDARKNAATATDAFLQLAPEERRGAQFVLLAPLAEGARAKLDARIAERGLTRDVVFLPRVSDDDLAFLYQQAELFLFPSLYEGFGLPVLEAMQCGAAIIAGNNSSIPEIANRADVLCDVSSSAAITRALAHGLRDANWRAHVRSWGLRRAKDFSWPATAERLIDGLLERAPALFKVRPRRETPACFALSETFETELANILRDGRTSSPSPVGIAPLALQSAPWLYDATRRRLLIDVTAIVASDRRTGIQRVVRNIVRALYVDAPAGANVVPVAVRLDAGRLRTCQAFVSDLLDCAQTVPDAPVEIGSGDCLLMLDNSWSDFDRFEPVFEQIRSAQGTVVTCVYDLIPELHPAASIDPVPSIYGAWLRKALLRSDGIITISEAVMHNLLGFVASSGVPHRRDLKVGWFRCGSNLDGDSRNAHAAVRLEVSRLFQTSDPVFLMVSTIEPRKGHAVALDAFDGLWSDNVSARLVILGSRGWHVEALIERISRGPWSGKRLFWIADASDAELSFAYEHCAALLNPSYAEGFGLPIAEAARASRPVICSDIPVFREVGRDGAAYFRVNDADALAGAVRNFLAGDSIPNPSHVLQTTWSEAASRIVDVIVRGQWSECLNEVERNKLD